MEGVDPPEGLGKAAAPTSAEVSTGQEGGEAVLTPRERVEASFRERQETADELNHLSNEWARGGEGRSYEQQRALEGPLQQKLQDQNVAFITEMVSHEPEAEAWVDYAREDMERTARNFGSQRLYGTTPTDRAWASINIDGARRHYREATENLAKVREKAGTSASTPQQQPTLESNK